MSKRRKRHSKAERQAFEAGQGYAVARSRSGMDIRNLDLRKSFAQGYAKARQMISKSSRKKSKKSTNTKG